MNIMHIEWNDVMGVALSENKMHRYPSIVSLQCYQFNLSFRIMDENLKYEILIDLTMKCDSVSF